MINSMEPQKAIIISGFLFVWLDNIIYWIKKAIAIKKILSDLFSLF